MHADGLFWNYGGLCELSIYLALTDVVEKGGVVSTLTVYASLEALLSPSRSDLHICGVVRAKRTDNGPSSARAGTRCMRREERP
jgi:hypothetical protein